MKIITKLITIVLGFGLLQAMEAPSSERKSEGMVIEFKNDTGYTLLLSIDDQDPIKLKAENCKLVAAHEAQKVSFKYKKPGYSILRSKLWYSVAMDAVAEALWAMDGIVHIRPDLLNGLTTHIECKNYSKAKKEEIDTYKKDKEAQTAAYACLQLCEKASPEQILGITSNDRNEIREKLLALFQRAGSINASDPDLTERTQRAYKDIVFEAYVKLVKKLTTETKIELKNDTRFSLIVCFNESNPYKALEAGQSTGINSKDIKSIKVRYEDTGYSLLSMIWVDINSNEIESQIDGSDITVHIKPYFNTLAIEIEKNCSEDSFAILLSTAKEEVFKQLDIDSGASAHEILGLDENASEDAIYQAYMELFRKGQDLTYPDRAFTKNVQDVFHTVIFTAKKELRDAKLKARGF